MVHKQSRIAKNLHICYIYNRILNYTEFFMKIPQYKRETYQKYPYLPTEYTIPQDIHRQL